MGTTFKFTYKGGKIRIQSPPGRVQFSVRWKDEYGGKKLDKPKVEIFKNIHPLEENDNYAKYKIGMDRLQQRMIDLILETEWAKKNKSLTERMVGVAAKYYVVPMIRVEEDEAKISQYGASTTQKYSANIVPIYPKNDRGEVDKTHGPIDYELGPISVTDRGGNNYTVYDLTRNTLSSEIFDVSYAFANGVRLTFGTFAHTVKVLEFPVVEGDAEFDLSGFDVPEYNPAAKSARKRPADDEGEPEPEAETETETAEAHEASAEPGAAEPEAESEQQPPEAEPAAAAAAAMEPPSISSLMRSSKKSRAN